MSLVPSLKAALRSPLLPIWLVPALLPLGRSPEIGVVLALLGTLMLFVRDPRALDSHPGARLLLWMFAAYFLAALVSAFDSMAPGKSWSTCGWMLRFAPLGIYVCFAVRRLSKLHALFFATAAVVALWVLDAWVQALTGWSLAGRAEPERISGIFGAANLKLGPALAVFSPFALWAARERWGLRGLVIAFVLVLGPVLLAGSRAAWLSYGLVALAFAWRESRSPLRFVALCAGAGVLLAAAMAIAWETSPRFEARMQHTLVALQGSSSAVDEALTGRLDIWKTSMRMAADHPVNGVGVRAFRYAYPHYAPANDHFVTAESCGDGEGACHPHQLLLEVLTETGLIGLLLWLTGAALAIRAWRQAGAFTRARAFPATVALGVAAFPLNTHLAFYSTWWGLVFWWLVAVWCAALYATMPETTEPAHVA
ncbi:MAG TPA: O-antigen ligase family protein [Luteibacter sp.]|nr:O-antigen ligase family protein [Luteibacter sp.]